MIAQTLETKRVQRLAITLEELGERFHVAQERRIYKFQFG